MLLQPPLDCVPLIGVAVRTHDGVDHDLLGDRAEEGGGRRVVLLELQLRRGRLVRGLLVNVSVGEERGVEAQGFQRGPVLLLPDTLDGLVATNGLLLRVRQRRTLAAAATAATAATAAWWCGVVVRRSGVVAR